MLRFWYRFLAGREPTPALAAEFETYVRATSPSTAQKILTTVRAFCRQLISEGTIAVYPFPADPRRPVPDDAVRWLLRFTNDRYRRSRRTCLRYGSLGKAKVAMVKYGDFYLPSDLGGYVHIFGSTFVKRGAVVQVGKRTGREFARWIVTV